MLNSVKNLFLVKVHCVKQMKVFIELQFKGECSVVVCIFSINDSSIAITH